MLVVGIAECCPAFIYLIYKRAPGLGLPLMSYMQPSEE